MIRKLIAYKPEELHNHFVSIEIKRWFEGGMVDEPRFNQIREVYKNDLFVPNMIMRLVLFVGTFIGVSFLFGLIAVSSYDMGLEGVRVLCGLFGVTLLLFTEKILIQNMHHYKSGVTEGGCYLGIGFIIFSLLGELKSQEWIYPALTTLMLVIISVRYVDSISLAVAFPSFLLTIAQLLLEIVWLMPFITIVLFSTIYYLASITDRNNEIGFWRDHMAIIKTFSLLFVYFGGNYFVVREMSVEMMDIDLSDGSDISFAWFFYAFTALVPIGYLVWGIKIKSILLLRVSLITLAITVFTLKYYFSLGHPEVSITIAGAFLTVGAIILMKYLKKERKGFIREKLLSNKWNNSNLTATIVSQTLGGHVDTKDNQLQSGNGEFGGGGASSKY